MQGLSIKPQDGEILIAAAGTFSPSGTLPVPMLITGGGVIALGGFTLTVPATGTAALLATAQTFTAANIIDAASGHPLILKANGTTFFSFLATAQVTCGATYASPTGTFRVFQITPIISGSMTSAFVSNTFWATTTTDFSSTNTVLAVEFAARIGSAAGTGGGVVTTAIGMQGVAQIGAAGVTITTGIAGNFSTTKGSGTIGTAIGVRIQACTGTTVIPLQVATSGGTAANFIGDQTGFGAVATNGNGLVQLQSGTTIAFGIAWGTDCFMYRTGTTAITLDCASGLTLTGGITMPDAKDIAFNTTTGTKIGTGTTQKFAFWNATPVVRPSGAAQAAVATTAATNVAPYGYTTAAQADGVITLLNEVRNQLTTLGLWKGAA